MPSVTVTVSVSEVLEVRDGPLTDIEIWAVLKEASEALQDIFLAGKCTLVEKMHTEVCPH